MVLIQCRPLQKNARSGGGSRVFCCVLMTFAVCRMVGSSDILDSCNRIVLCRWGCGAGGPPGRCLVCLAAPGTARSQTPSFLVLCP